MDTQGNAVSLQAATNEANEYYREFDQRTDGGRRGVLGQDLSGIDNLPQTTTEEEVTAREEWNNLRNNLFVNYLGRPERPQWNGNDNDNIPTQNLFLLERVVPPQYVQHGAAERNPSERRNPYRPDRIIGWTDFDGDHGVHAFTPADGDASLFQINPQINPHIIARNIRVFMSSLESGTVAVGETQEQSFLTDNVFAKLRRAGLIDYSDSTEVQCLPDFVLSRPRQQEDGPGNSTRDLRVAIEFKSTQNLLLPMNTDGIVMRYQNGMSDRPRNANANANADGEGDRDRDGDRSNVCDTLGQLFRYMVENNVRYGALSSASRTYFCFLGGDNAEHVHVSRAWFVGERDYLRAWAYIYHRADNDDLPQYDKNSVTYRTIDHDYLHPSSSDDDDESGASGYNDSKGGGKRPAPRRRSPRFLNKKRKGTEGSSSVALPIVPPESIEFLNAIGCGRNGSVFRARWEGKDVAVKQFDTERPLALERFREERKAYEQLCHAQGMLIPRAWFVSQSCAGILYLGLQLGRAPKEGDDVSALRKVLKNLQEKYGFRHRDSCVRNSIFIKDEEGSEEERLVVVDLEEYEWMNDGKKPKYSTRTI